MSAAEENNNSSVGSTGAASRPETPEVLRGEKLDVELDVRWAENGTSDYAWLCRFQNLRKNRVDYTEPNLRQLPA